MSMETISSPSTALIECAPGLPGRELDLDVIRTFVSGVADGGGALVLSGEPGVGKSALLDAAAGMAAEAGIRVLRAAGAGFEDVSFAGLNQVLLPLRDEFGLLDALQRNALNVALGLDDGPPGDRLVVSNAALALLCRAAADRPVLVVVDDAPRLDRASALVLGFAARRLGGSRVGFLAAARSGAQGFFGPDMPGHEIRPLDEQAAADVLDARFPGLAAGVRQRIVAEAQGNPLALLELPAMLSDGQRAGVTAMPAVLPLSRRLRTLFVTRVSELPAPTRYLLLLAALDGTGNIGVLQAAAGEQLRMDDLDPAERAGLVYLEEDTGRLAFSHPLIRSAVMALSASGEVRRAHAALAGQLRDQPERRAWHLAEAAIEPDEVVAGLLGHAARKMLRRGEATGAVTALMRAAQLSPQGCDRSRRLAEAAYLGATVTGELPSVRRLLAEARQAAPQPAGSQPAGSLHATVAAAHLLLNTDGDIDTVHGMLVHAIKTAPGAFDAYDGTLIAALQTLLLVCSFGGRPDLWEPFEEAMAGLIPSAPAELSLLAGTYADPARSAVGVLDQLDAAISDLPRVSDHSRILALGAAAAHTDRLAGCREALRRVADEGRRGGALLPAITALTLLSMDGFTAGGWDDAHRLAGECLQACQAHGYPSRAWMAREQLAVLAAARGEDDVVRELTGEMVRWALPRGIVQARMAAHRAGSLAALGRGNFEEAYREAAAISPPGTLAPAVPHALWVAMDLVEAAVRTGRRDEAAAHVAAMREAGLAEISPRLAMLTAACAAIAAPACEASQLFERALAVPGAGRWPFELARVQLAYGEHLRRARATGDARARLGAALATFRALGARPWADRAAGELRATGLAATRSQGHGSTTLTAQEREIATLAAAGLTNKQIGQRLYLSHRTVADHLYQVFPKLGISTRAALRDALTAGTG
jgi:DNA-binding CsgD family transcriptional regulator